MPNSPRGFPTLLSWVAGGQRGPQPPFWENRCQSVSSDLFFENPDVNDSCSGALQSILAGTSHSIETDLAIFDHRPTPSAPTTPPPYPLSNSTGLWNHLKVCSNMCLDTTKYLYNTQKQVQHAPSTVMGGHRAGSKVGTKCYGPGSVRLQTF